MNGTHKHMEASLKYFDDHIYSLLIKKDICDHQTVSVKLLCVYVFLSSTDLFIFLVRISSFFSYFLLEV